MTFAASADKSETKKKIGFKNNILPLVCDNRDIIVNLIKNTNKNKVMYGKLKDFLTQELANIKAAGLYKNERIITTPQRADIKVNAGSDVFELLRKQLSGPV